MDEDMKELPVIDISPLRSGGEGADAVASAIDEACRDVGFFCIAEHGASLDVLSSLDEAARRFFALPEAEKAEIAMARAGAAWRGWFPLGGELTSGRTAKEGLYFGEELDVTDARVRAGRPCTDEPLPERPARPSELRAGVDGRDDRARPRRHAGRGDGARPAAGVVRGRADPRTDRAVPHLPLPAALPDANSWGVGEHTDYGLLTILAQDSAGGLQVRGPGGWIDVPALPGVLVCNIGDMLDRMTGGRYRSTPHRVRNTSGQDRLSFPFFFDPGWDARAAGAPCRRGTAGRRRRPVGRLERPPLGGHLRRLPAGKGQQGLPRPEPHRPPRDYEGSTTRPDVGEAAVGEAARVTSAPRRRGPSGGCVRSRPAPRDP